MDVREKLSNEKRLIDVNKVINSMQKCLDESPDKRHSVAYFAFEKIIECLKQEPTVDAVEVVHGRWEAGRCSNCKEEAVSTSFDEPIYDYDWEENLRYSHTETYTEYHLTNYCPNCGAKMDLEG